MLKDSKIFVLFFECLTGGKNLLANIVLRRRNIANIRLVKINQTIKFLFDYSNFYTARGWTRLL